MQIKKDEIICLTYGDYSAFGISTFARALIDFDTQQVLYDLPDDAFHISESKAISWLVRNGYIIELEPDASPTIVHLCDYVKDGKGEVFSY